MTTRTARTARVTTRSLASDWETRSKIVQLRGESLVNGDFANAIVCAKALGVGLRDLSRIEAGWLRDYRLDGIGIHVRRITRAAALREAISQIDTTASEF